MAWEQPAKQVPGFAAPARPDSGSVLLYSVLPAGIEGKGDATRDHPGPLAHGPPAAPTLGLEVKSTASGWGSQHPELARWAPNREGAQPAGGWEGAALPARVEKGGDSPDRDSSTSTCRRGGLARGLWTQASGQRRGRESPTPTPEPRSPRGRC